MTEHCERGHVFFLTNYEEEGHCFSGVWPSKLLFQGMERPPERPKSGKLSRKWTSSLRTSIYNCGVEVFVMQTLVKPDHPPVSSACPGACGGARRSTKKQQRRATGDGLTQLWPPTALRQCSRRRPRSNESSNTCTCTTVDTPPVGRKGTLRNSLSTLK